MGRPELLLGVDGRALQPDPRHGLSPPRSAPALVEARFADPPSPEERLPACAGKCASTVRHLSGSPGVPAAPAATVAAATADLEVSLRQLWFQRQAAVQNRTPPVSSAAAAPVAGAFQPPHAPPHAPPQAAAAVARLPPPKLLRTARSRTPDLKVPLLDLLTQRAQQRGFSGGLQSFTCWLCGQRHDHMNSHLHHILSPYEGVAGCDGGAHRRVMARSCAGCCMVYHLVRSHVRRTQMPVTGDFLTALQVCPRPRFHTRMPLARTAGTAAADLTYPHSACWQHSAQRDRLRRSDDPLAWVRDSTADAVCCVQTLDAQKPLEQRLCTIRRSEGLLEHCFQCGKPPGAVLMGDLVLRSPPEIKICWPCFDEFETNWMTRLAADIAHGRTNAKYAGHGAGPGPSDPAAFPAQPSQPSQSRPGLAATAATQHAAQHAANHKVPKHVHAAHPRTTQAHHVPQHSPQHARGQAAGYHGRAPPPRSVRLSAERASQCAASAPAQLRQHPAPASATQPAARRQDKPKLRWPDMPADVQCRMLQDLAQQAPLRQGTAIAAVQGAAKDAVRRVVERQREAWPGGAPLQEQIRAELARLAGVITFQLRAGASEGDRFAGIDEAQLLDAAAACATAPKRPRGTPPPTDSRDGAAGASVDARRHGSQPLWQLPRGGSTGMACTYPRRRRRRHPAAQSCLCRGVPQPLLGACHPWSVVLAAEPCVNTYAIGGSAQPLVLPSIVRPSHTAAIRPPTGSPDLCTLRYRDGHHGRYSGWSS